MAQRIAFVMRPDGGDELLEEYRSSVRLLRERGHEVRPSMGFERGDAAAFARAAARERFDLVVAAGGDGTVNEVVNGIAPEPWWPRLAVIPTGTANDFATGLDVPREVAAATTVALDGREREIDLARANDRYFINVSTGGFGAEATEATPPEIKKLLGPFAYLVTGVRHFVELKAVAGTFRSEGRILHDGEFLLFAVGNGRRTGGGSLLTPRAELDDGELDVCLVPALPRMDFLALLPDLRAGTHVESEHVVYARVRELSIEARETIHVNVDGEPIPGRAFHYSVTDRRISVMVPD